MSKQLGKAPAHQDQDWDSGGHEQTTELPLAEPTVRVRCIVDTLPWTFEKALANGEEADVPASLADLMRKKKQVEIVKGGHDG